MTTSLTRRAAVFGALTSTVALAVPAVAAAKSAPDVTALITFLREDKDCIYGVWQDRQLLADMLEGKAPVPAPVEIEWVWKPTEIPGVSVSAPTYAPRKDLPFRGKAA